MSVGCKRTVIKLGGSVLQDAGLRDRLVSQVVALARRGEELILVHGGGKQIASLLGRLSIESSFHDGLRITGREARDAAQMVLAGQVGKDLVAEFSRRGMPCVSIAGGDGMSFLAEKMNAEDGTDLGFVGRINRTSPALIDALLGSGFMPIVACLALGGSDFEYYNVNGDQMAAAVAGGCGAGNLVFVTDVGAVMDADGRPIPTLDRRRMEELLASGVAGGGMRPKLRACLEALDAGVGTIRIVGAGEDEALARALERGPGFGTLIS